MAQVRSATITGTVQDSSGAVVVGASVGVTNSDTHTSFTSTTNRTGDYTVPYLQNGTYSVTITKTGFKQFIVESLHLDPGQTAKVDASLTIGATTETVQVQASALLMQTETSEVAGITTAEQIDSLPNISENPFYYAGLQNGVVPRNQTSSTQNANSFGIGVAGRAQASAFGVNGGRAFENEIQLDGLPITGDGFNEAAVTPNLESMQELQVHTNDFSAEYGRGQGVISITTKSGSNAFHGVVSYQNRNDGFNANTAQNKSTPTTVNGVALTQTPRPIFKVNDIGLSVTGPIRKDHLFFSASYHYLTRNAGGVNTATVPTALERNGDFGASLIANSAGQPAPVQIFSPFNLGALPTQQVTQVAPNTWQRPEFPVSANCSQYKGNALYPGIAAGGQLVGGTPSGCGDIITNPNAVGLTILKAYPLPNVADVNLPNKPYNTSNFTVTAITTYRKYTSNNRIDWKRGPHSIYGSGGVDWGTILVPPAFGKFATPGLNDAPSTTSDRNPYAQVGDTVTLSPSLFLDVRYGITRIHAISFAGNHSGFSNYSGFGIAPATQALFAAQGAAPVIAPGGTTWSGLVGGQFANKEERQISHTISASATKIKGNLDLKFGFTDRVMLANYTDFEEASTNLGGCCANDVGGYTANFINANGQPVNNSGTFSNTVPQQQGLPGALTLVGEGVWFVRPGANLKPAYAAKDLAIWTQNNWKIKPNLTLNLGLRWEVQPGLTERGNRMAGYDFNATTAFGTLGAIDFPGTNGYSRNLWNTEWNDWQPVLGFAWQIKPSFVAHGGYRTTYLPSNSGYFSSPNDYGEATFASGNTGAQTYGSDPNGIPTEKITDAAPLVAATLSNYAAPQIYGVGQAYFDRHLKNQIAKQANFFLEKSFGKSGQWLVSAGWTGAWSDHLSTRNLAFQNVQLIPAATLSSWRATYITNNGSGNPQTALVANPYQPANCGAGSGQTKPLPFQGVWSACMVQKQYTMFPYPLLQGGGLNGSRGFAKYNSLQARIAHTLHGLHFEGNFTWSKELDFVTTAIEDGQGVNPSGSISNTDLVNNRANQNYGTDDMPLRFVGIIVYQSPFGQGGMFALSNPVARAIAGGWQVSSVFTMNDGFPVFVSGANNGAITGRVHRIPGVPVLLPQAQRIRYNDSTTKITLPCGVIVTPGRLNEMKYNLCAFQGQTVLGADGTSILADQYWYGDSPNTFGDMRGPGRTNVDLTLRRQFPLNERFKLEISALASNLANHPEWSSVNGGGLGGTTTTNKPSNGQIVGYGSGAFGNRGMGTFDPRQIQLQGRITF